MNLPTFGQLLAEYMQRAGISDSELARNIGVRRQTIFRWKEGLVERPRARDDVLQCAKKLRLTDEERDRLLLAAGFAPEQLAPDLLRNRPSADAAVSKENLSHPASAPPAEDQPTFSPATPSFPPENSFADHPVTAEFATTDPAITGSDTTEQSRPTLLPKGTTAVQMMDMVDPEPTDLAKAPVLPLSPRQKAIPRLFADPRLRWWPAGATLIVLLLLGLLWTRSASLVVTTTPTPPAPATVVLHPPPQVTPTVLPQEFIAGAGETLLLIAQFKGYTPAERYNVAGRISEELEQQIAASGLISTTVLNWPEEIPNGLRARQLLTAANATMIIWGEYDSGRVRVNLEARDPKASQSRNFTPTPADELVTTINTIVPKEIRDTALIALGTLASEQNGYQMAVGRLLSNLGNYQAAATVFQQALDHNPRDETTAALLNFYLGYLTEKTQTLNDYNRAITYYGRAFALDPHLFDALYNRGTVQIKRAHLLPANETMIVESLTAAIADLTTVITQRPDYLNGYLNRGVAYYERDEPGDMAAALADLSHVIIEKADYTHAYYLRGLVHIRAGNGMQWVDDFQQTLAQQPDHEPAVSALCWGYVLAQQPEIALAYCDQAVNYDTTAASRDSRAIAYAYLGRYAEAVTDFRTYLEWMKSQPLTFYARNRGALVVQWIVQLEAGENPFDPALLEELRHRDHY